MVSFGKYIKAAFTVRWNLLAFFGGVAFAFLSGHPDIWGALVLAAEVGYLGLLGTHDKFQRYVDAQDALAARDEHSQNVERALKRIMNALPSDLLQKFQTLRERCEKLRQIALDLKEPGRARGRMSLEELQLAGLDRLLWIYLKLLFTEHSLSGFFEQTDEQKIRQEIKRVEDRIESVTTASTSSQRERLLGTLQDNLQTCQDRLDNFQKARDNYELVTLEIERLENKIRSLSELAVNRHEPDFISGQVDEVAGSMLKTERTINELQFATGLQLGDDEVPELVQRQTIGVTR